MNPCIAAQFDDGGELASIWDYDPPGDLAGSGAWNVLRELATTLSRYSKPVTLPTHKDSDPEKQGSPCRVYICISFEPAQAPREFHTRATSWKCASALI